jgi:hypothetical protein
VCDDDGGIERSEGVGQPFKNGCEVAVTVTCAAASSNPSSFLDECLGDFASINQGQRMVMP